MQSSRNRFNSKNKNQRQKELFNKKSLSEKIEAAKRRALEKQQQNQQQIISNKNEEEIIGLGSNKLHPLLFNNLDATQLIQNTLQNHQSSELHSNKFLNFKVQSNISREVLNPYFDPTEKSTFQSRRKRKGLEFNEKGKYIKIAAKIREEEAKTKQEYDELKKKEELGLVPNYLLNENMYKPVYPAKIEWYDKPYFLKSHSYEDLNFTKFSNNHKILVENTDADPITQYIQHPVAIESPWESNIIQTESSLFLTKKELKRIRKKSRSEAHKEKQDKIKLGLEPQPAPKVKLSNLINVLTNQVIQDPTAVEARVRQEIQERKQQHLRSNEERKLTVEQKREKIEKKIEKDLEVKGVHCFVATVDELISKQHFYKITTNANELKLMGVCLTNTVSGFTMIIAEGSLNNINKFKHLLLDRINWKEYVENIDKETDISSDMQIDIHKQQLQQDNESQDHLTLQKTFHLPNNKCQTIWEGPLLNFRFKKWTNYKFELNINMLDFLTPFKCDSYLRYAFQLHAF